MKIKVNDLVEVISGKQKGKRARVASVNRKAGKVTVEGTRLVKKHIKPNRRNPKGGILSIEQPIDMSNVMIVCPSCQKASRMGSRFLEDGTKELYCKKCGKTFRTLSTAPVAK